VKKHCVATVPNQEAKVYLVTLLVISRKIQASIGSIPNDGQLKCCRDPHFRVCRSIQGPKMYVKINEVRVILVKGIQRTIKGVKGYENRVQNMQT
jgi:hypothetical protein